VIKEEPYTLRVPRSQRGGEVVEPLVRDQWFVKMGPLAERALAAVAEGDVRIIPERFEKTYNHWLENIRARCSVLCWPLTSYDLLSECSVTGWPRRNPGRALIYLPRLHVSARHVNVGIRIAAHGEDVHSWRSRTNNCL